jgi:formylmethanofuran dehydrogenase subunit E
MDDYEFFVNKVTAFHGHVCTGIVLGTRMSLAAMRYLGLDPHQQNRNILAYAEIDRCMTDAVMVITGCSLGRRTLKHIDYGKFAVTLINQDSGIAVRAIVKEDFSRKDNMDETIRLIASISDERLITLQTVQVDISEYDLPGFPRRSAVCAVCGEQVMDGRDIIRNGVTLCRGCTGGNYYTVPGEKIDAEK